MANLFCQTGNFTQIESADDEQSRFSSKNHPTQFNISLSLSAFPSDQSGAGLGQSSGLGSALMCVCPD